MFATHVAAALLSHVHVAATWMVQEGGGAIATDPIGLVESNGMGSENRRHHSLHHVGLVDRRDDRPLDGL